MNAACSSCGRGVYWRNLKGSAISGLVCTGPARAGERGICGGKLRLADNAGRFVGTVTPRQRWLRFIAELRRRAELERAKAQHYRRAFVEDRAYFDRYYAKIHGAPRWLSRDEQAWAAATMRRAIVEHVEPFAPSAAALRRRAFDLDGSSS
jgi:hypothetical protein